MAIVRISELSWGGKGIGRIDGKVIFIPHSLPGEIVEAEVTQAKNQYSHGELKRILEPSPERIDPPCPQYGQCGGCQLQHLALPSQIQEKERLFTAGLRHALKSEEITILPTLKSFSKFGYRHRLHLKTSWENSRFTLGFFKPKSHRLISVDHCLLANEPINRILSLLRNKIQALHLKNWSPDIEIQIFENPLKGGIIFSSSTEVTPVNQKKVIKKIRDIPGLNYCLFRGFGPLPRYHGPFTPEKDTPEVILPAAKTGLEKDIKILCFPGVFTQINLELNQKLINRIVSLPIFDSKDTLLDCYSGLGNFSLPLALKMKEIIGIETSPFAVDNALWNQKINKIPNCTFIQGKVENANRLLEKSEKSIAWAILDPPRAGALEVIPILDSWKLRGLLYISCNPMTLFRDLKALISRGWAVQWSQPIDFFPQTYHLESMTLIIKERPRG